MRILFINISLRPDSNRKQLPVGLAYVMTAVKKAGFDFDLMDMDIDCLTLNSVEKIISSARYDVYALGCIVTGYKFVKKIAAFIKSNNPKAIIIAGNSVATSIPEILLKNTMVDVAVLGEGDITLVELLRVLDSDNKDISQVKGIAFKGKNEVFFTSPRPVIADLDELGFPDWEIFNLEKYYEFAGVNTISFDLPVKRAFPLNSARGCPFNCTFCYHVFKKQKYRRYTENAISSEIKRLRDKYECDFISFWDELTFSTIKSVEDAIRMMGSLDFKIGWKATIRGNLFKKEHVWLVRELKNAGCDNIGDALENADPEILMAINKKIRVEDFIEQAKTIWEGGITPITSVIFGYPQETPETIRKTLDVCRQCNIYPSAGFLLPLPGTPIYEWSKNNGYITDEVEYLENIGERQDLNVNLTKMSNTEFVRIVREELESLAVELGIVLSDVMRTGGYKRPDKNLIC